MSKFTKSHYELVAEILRKEYDSDYWSDDQANCRALISTLANRFAEQFEKDNPRFDWKRFMKAATG